MLNRDHIVTQLGQRRDNIYFINLSTYDYDIIYYKHNIAASLDRERRYRKGKVSLIFSLLHFHFEAVLRTIAIVRPELLKNLYGTFRSTQYYTASPAQRLYLLEGQIQQLAQSNQDLFTEEIFESVAQTFLKQLELSHVEHVDLRIGVTPKKWRWMSTIADGIQVFERELQRYPTISLSFLGALNFAKSFAEIDEIFEVLLGDPFVHKTFAGVDINVLPEDLPKLMHYAPVLLLAQQQGMKVNIHLGELFDNTVSKEILSYIVPHRIGHGVRLLEDESLVAFIQQHDICLDMCPVSNSRLGVYHWRQPNNPAKKAIQLGIPVTMNTDDPILFQTTLSREIALARLTAEEVRMIQATGRKYRYRHE
jgi:adenosine deaminase